MATTITQARSRINGVTPIDVGGYEHEVDEDIDEFFDKDSLRLQSLRCGLRRSQDQYQNGTEE
jgi:hypothetical protein